MEAVALYTFRATEGDELSFNKGDMLKVRCLFSVRVTPDFFFGDGFCFCFVFCTVGVVVKNFARLQNSLISTPHRRTFHHTSL